MIDPPCTAASCGIYAITNKRTGRRYIGQTTQTFDTRWKPLKKRGKHNNQKLQADWHELGPDAFEFEILEVCPDDLSEEERYTWCNEREVAHIGDDYLTDDLYNDRPGGGNSPMAEETRKSISETLTGKPKSEEHRQNISKSKLGENNPLWGKTLSEETRQKISEALTGKPKSEEHRQNMSKAQSGENNNFYGKTHTEETKKKMSENIAKSDYCKNRPRKTCPWCGKTAAINNFARYHGNNCKHRPQGSPDAL